MPYRDGIQVSCTSINQGSVWAGSRRDQRARFGLFRGGKRVSPWLWAALAAGRRSVIATPALRRGGGPSSYARLY